jgi:hypothetical protein
MKTITDRLYRHQNVVLDDTGYKGCTFDECTFLYSGGTINLQDNKLIRPRLVMTGSAANTMDVLKLLYHAPGTRLIAQAFLDEIVRP